MALSDNPFIGLPLVDLQDLQTKYIQVLKDLATGGQSYTFPGRSFTRADLAECRNTLAMINTAISSVSGASGGKQIAQAIIDTQSRFAG
jgi:hypothetical protein